MEEFEIIIIGGGPGGLTAGIHLAGKGIRTLVLEKKSYPHHKVCGEYLSNEVVPYLNRIGVDLRQLQPPEIRRIQYTTQTGKNLEADLPMGGLGLSRYALDQYLYQVALQQGVSIRREKVTGVEFRESDILVRTNKTCYKGRFALGAYGKRDILDKKLHRDFIASPAPWVAVKAHYEYPEFPEDLVMLNTFPGGYCGLSRTETGAVNMCYLATYKSFKMQKDPSSFQKIVMGKNPWLAEFFHEAVPLFQKPLSIAQISFGPKTRSKANLLMVGDAAGLIHPLCGNGMAMAIHSAKIAAEVLVEYLEHEKPLSSLSKDYAYRWDRQFQSRLRMGRYLQKVLLHPALERLSRNLMIQFPALLPAVIERTHGKVVV